jgi:photosystem II stability/assembly factor-like uncharacterized protein
MLGLTTACSKNARTHGPSVRSEPGDAAEAALERRLAAGEVEDEYEAEATGAREASAYRDSLRLDRNGEIQPGALMRAKRQTEEMRELRIDEDHQVADAGIWSWSYLGPDNIGGRVRTICFVDSDTIYIGGVHGGIWRTDDGGSSWSHQSDFLASLAVTSIVVDPGNPNRLFAGTGEGFAVNNRATGSGVFRTTNGGTNWTHLGETVNWRFTNRLAIVPGTNTIFAAVAEGSAGDPNNRGVWRSINWGDEWDLVLPDVDALDVKVSPTNPSLIMVGTNEGLYTSSVGGDAGSWFDQTNGGFQKLPADAQRCEVFFGANGWLWTSMCRGNDLDGDSDTDDMQIWRSTNGGSSWSLRHSGTNYAADQSAHDNTIWVAPDDPNVIVVGGVEVWRSLDGGATLNQISSSGNYDEGLSAHADQHMVIHPPDYGPGNRNVYVANDGGIQRIDDIYTVGQVSGWTNLINGVGITQFYHAAAHVDDYFIGGSQDNGVERLHPGDGDGGWLFVVQGDGCDCAINPDDPNIQYGSTQRLSIRKSTDAGTQFSTVINGLDDAGDSATAPFITKFEMAPSDPEILVTGGTSIWRTDDGAANWDSIRDPIDNDPNVDDPKCTAIEIAPTDADRIWVGYANGRVSRTTNSVSSWINVDGPIPDRAITDIAVNPYFSNEVFVTVGGFETDTVWYSNDEGQTWHPRNGSGATALPAVHINSIEFHPLNTNWIYVGTDLGLFASEDDGQTWNRTPRFGGVGHDGPVNTEVAEVFFQGTQYLCAATHGRGLWRVRTLPIVYVDEANIGFEDGTQADPYDTVGEGYNAAGHGSTISIRAADYVEGPRTLSKRLRVIATNGLVRIH